MTIAGLKEFYRERLDITYLDGPHAAAGEPYPDVKKFFQGPFHEWWNVAVVSNALDIMVAQTM